MTLPPIMNPKPTLSEQELEKLKNHFVTTMSHEVRTPLSVILLSTKLLKNHGHQCGEEKRIEYLQKIELAARQLDHLFNRYLTHIGADPSPLSCKNASLPHKPW